MQLLNIDYFKFYKYDQNKTINIIINLKILASFIIIYIKLLKKSTIF